MPVAGELFGSINYWAVAVAGLIAFFLGGLWYSPALFEKAWMSANGYGAEELRRIQASLGPAGFGATFAAYLAMAAAFAVVAALVGIDGVGGGLALAGLVWVGFVATSGLTVNLFSLRPRRAWTIDAGFQLVALLTTGAILGAWR